MSKRMRRLFKKCAICMLSGRPYLRRKLARCGEVLDRMARIDLADNSGIAEGELLVQDILLRHVPKTKKLIVFDVGANVGLWTKSLLERGQATACNNLEIHAFEPCQTTYQMLQETLKSCGMEDKVITINKALSNSTGISILYVAGDGVGVNSLHPSNQYERIEEVSTIKLDDYCSEKALKHITFLKIDAEGHDFPVIEGASKMLASSNIRMIQFEYNHRWVFSRHCLQEVFNLFKPFSYRIGKITPKGIEFYDVWHPLLENFRQSNYLVCQEECLRYFPKIQWWHRE